MRPVTSPQRELIMPVTSSPKLPPRSAAARCLPTLRKGALAGVVLGLAGGFFGCNRAKSPPQVPVVAAKPVDLPKPPVPTDETMFAYLNVRDPIPLIQQAGGTAYLERAVQLGMKIADFQTGAPLLGFLWDPQGASVLEVPALVLAPLPIDGDMVGFIKKTSPGMRAIAVGGPNQQMTALSVGEAVQDRLKAGSGEFLALAQARQPFDVTLHINAAAIMEKYGPMLRVGLQAMGPAIAQAAAQGRSATALSPKSTVAMFEQMLNGLEDLKAITLGANLTQTELSLTSLTRTRSGDPKKGGPIAAPDLAQFVPPGDLKLQWSTRELKQSIDWYLRLYGGFLAEKPELKKQIDETIQDWFKAGQSIDAAASMSFGKNGLVFQGIMRVDNSVAAMAALRRSMRLFAGGPVSDLYKSLGVELTIKNQQGVRKLRGNVVDRYEYSFKAGGGNVPVEPAAKAMLEKLSGLSYEVMQTGPYLVYSIGAPLETVADPLFDGQGPYPMNSRKLFPAGGSLYLELDLAAMLRWMKTLVPADQGQRLPSLPARGSVISVWSYDSGAVSYQKVHVPISLVDRITGNNQMM